MKYFADKVAVITGGGSGIGKSIANELLKYGSKVVIAEINQNILSEFSENKQIHVIVTDVTNFDSMKNLIDQTIKLFGKIDFLFNNAGINVISSVEETAISDWHKVISVNLFGVINGINCSYSLMQKQGFGHIVNVSSIQGIVPFPSAIAYTTSKFGVSGLTLALAIEALNYGINVSLVCPGFVNTPIRNSTKYIGIEKEEFLKSTFFTPISPEECAKKILKGVSKKKVIIPITYYSKIVWSLYRFFPVIFIKLSSIVFRKYVTKKFQKEK